jgi:hypothetical protein
LFGLGLILLSLDILIDQPGMSATVDALTGDRPAMLTIALVTVIAGLATVLAHNVWSGGAAPVLVTLCGWAMVVKGALLLFVPLSLVSRFPIAPAWLYMSGTLGLLWGAYLAYAGFRAPATVAPTR